MRAPNRLKSDFVRAAIGRQFDGMIDLQRIAATVGAYKGQDKSPRYLRLRRKSQGDFLVGGVATMERLLLLVFESVQKVPATGQLVRQTATVPWQPATDRP